MPKPKQLTRDDLKNMTPEQVMNAQKNGQTVLLTLDGRQATEKQFLSMSIDARRVAYDAGLLNNIIGLSNDETTTRTETNK